jgi:CHAT domain-containing protein
VAPLQDAVEFRLGEALQVEQRADETRTFRINLEAGKDYLLEADQRELDLIIEITGPDGISRTYDAPLLRFEPERLLIEPKLNGPHSVRTRSDDHKGGTVGYRILVTELSPATAAMARRRDAHAAETRAATAHYAGGIEDWQTALSMYQSAVSTWKDLDDNRAHARAQLAVATLLYLRSSDWERAAREAQVAAGLYQAIGAPGLFSSALHIQGAVLIEAANEVRSSAALGKAAEEAENSFTYALSHLVAAEQIKDDLNEAYERGRIVNDIGLAHYNKGNWIAARQHFTKAAQILGSVQEWAEELKATANIATVDYAEGNLGQALLAYQRVLELMRPDAISTYRRGDLLDNMGAAQRALGQVDNALTSFTQALAEHEKVGSPEGRGRSLSGIGVTYFSTGELDLAREYLERAISIRRQARDGPGLVSTLLYLGSVYLQQGDLDAAIKAHQEATELAVNAGQRARAQVALGRDLAVANEIDEALQILTVARSTAEEAGTPIVVADALLERGRLLIADGRSTEAIGDLQRALAQYEELGWPTGEAGTWYELARAERANGQLSRASEYAEASIQRIETLRSMISSPELRASFLASQQDHFSLYIDVAMDLASRGSDNDRRIWAERALNMSERARTRAMLDLLQEAQVGIVRTADPALAERRTELYQALAGLRFRQDRLLQRQRDSQVLSAVRIELSRIETELQVLEHKLRDRDPRYASLSAPQSLDAAAIQASLDEDSLLLQYALGNEKSWLFAVSKESLSVHLLPPRVQVEAIARLAFNLLQKLDPDPSAQRRRSSALEQLSKLLVVPAMPLKPRLIIAADGALHYVPFAALNAAWNADSSQSLAARHELVSVPSISVVAAQRQIRSKRNDFPHRSIAIFADPVFQDSDSRFGAESVVANTEFAGPPPARASQWNPAALGRLPAAGHEAEAISELVSSDDRLVATGFDANLKAVLGADLSAFRILHFATHALVDDQFPALSALAFSRFDANRLSLDAFLRLHDIYNLELAADLVTLSACETALGREVRGEGLVGLTRGFLYAGGSSVVASLWQVPDRATAELMRWFYKGQLQDGLSPPAALRQAQVHISAVREWRDPFYWAGFVIYGEWQPIAGSAPIQAQ